METILSQHSTTATNESNALTQTFARYLASTSGASFPDKVRHEAARTFTNWVGCAVGGARHEAVDIALAAVTQFSGTPEASVLGRSERLDAMSAALVNGISSHVFDFDDTHLRTVIHPAGPVASALLAFCQHHRISGSEFIDALILGIEAECRIGNAVYPSHYDIGWHITGTTGVFGAAVAIGRVLGLDAERMGFALGIAASQPVGLREMFGSMTKSFHPGRAAQNGMLAAVLAAKGYTSSAHGLEAKRGWLNVVATNHDSSEITDGLGERFEILANSYKPFACGIVIHPTIDACIQLRNQDGIDATDVRAVELNVHPLVLELTGKTEPKSGLEGKFSVYHAAAVALIEGDGGERQFSDRAVRDRNVVDLRRRISAKVDTAIAPDQVRVVATLSDGRTVEKYIEHAIGSVDRPMTDADLERKFMGLAEVNIGASKARALLDLCWSMDKLEDAAMVAEGAQV